MNDLKSYTDLQKLTGMSDMEIIIQYFIDNDMEEEAMNICHKLANSKIQKMKDREHIVREWAYTIPSDYLYKNYPIEIATMLHRMALDYIINGEVTDSRLEWARENVPNIERPLAYFQPCIKWLEEKGIEFMEDEE